MLHNPENLPLNRLKEELRKRGISFETGKNKDYYVSLYKHHFAKKGVSTRQTQRSEFSSDDEPFNRAPKTPPRDRRYTKVLNVDHYLRQLAPISDSELLKELRKHNVDAGPITDTTRPLYEKKLAKIMAEKARTSVSNSSSAVTIASGSDEEDDDDEFSSEDEIDSPMPPPQRQPLPPRKQVTESTVKQRVSYSSSSSSTHSPSYNLRSKYFPQAQQPAPISAIKQMRRPEKIAPPEETITTHDTLTSSSGKFARPYRPSWFSNWYSVQLVLLMISFLVGFIIFDYIRNGDSRVIVWAQQMLNNTFKQQKQ